MDLGYLSEPWRASPTGIPPQEHNIALNELLVRVARGDRKAFAALYDDTASHVYGLVLTMMGNAARAEEVTNEVYLQLWRTAARYDPACGHAQTLLLQMARHTALNHVRATDTANRRGIRFRRQRHATPIEDIAAGVVCRLRGASLRAALDSLENRSRDVLVVIYYRGYTADAVARVLGAPVATVHAWLSTALNTLQRAVPLPPEREA